jgi:hypothetical protein
MEQTLHIESPNLASGNVKPSATAFLPIIPVANSYAIARLPSEKSSQRRLSIIRSVWHDDGGRRSKFILTDENTPWNSTCCSISVIVSYRILFLTFPGMDGNAITKFRLQERPILPTEIIYCAISLGKLQDCSLRHWHCV